MIMMFVFAAWGCICFLFGLWIGSENDYKHWSKIDVDRLGSHG